uniref:GpW protein n=1 Tax=Candidatus Kentrum sp. LFY TaxID=2126342 RepID=A0A450WC81_9GAMM|nr:MAG: gpW protein [Candidatus Kentron sp. LFY]
MTDCETRLSQAKAALHELMTGAQTVEAEVEGQRVKYTPASKRGLQNYIRQLETECGRVRWTPTLGQDLGGNKL